MNDKTYDDAVKAAAEALLGAICRNPREHDAPCRVCAAEAAVAAAAPILLAPVQVEVERLRHPSQGEEVTLRSRLDRMVRVALLYRAERDEAVAANSRRIAAAIRAMHIGIGHDQSCRCPSCQVRERAARIAETVKENNA